MFGIRRAELAMDGGAAATLAAAVGYSIATATSSQALAASGAALALLGCFRCLRAVDAATAPAGFTPFDVRLLFEAADRVQTSANSEVLELDDILEQTGPQSRVVQLFDRDAMPTPGQLKARIDRHLVQGSSPAAPPDASQDLFAALAELRRSLR